MTQPWIEGRFEENVVTTTVEQAINWAEEKNTLLTGKKGYISGNHSIDATHALRARFKINSHFGSPIYPAQLRCSSLE